MTEPKSPGGLLKDDLLDRILAVDSALVALRCEDVDGLVKSLRAIAQRTGKAIYWWRARVGLCRLPGLHEIVPGMVHLADVLRFVANSPHFGVYFIVDSPPEWSPDLLALLQRIAKTDPQQQRRLVLPGALADLPAALPARELAWSRRAGPQPRLRHGAWVR
ncbi:MAG TPA: hypothetical protein VFW60_07210 [Rhodanobacteraceae bacterium]|nr:hypothetical protein [Rhodanobacteraceae bacterium]